MKTPEEKYAGDSKYRHFVDLIENLIHNADFTPSELREMVIYACIRDEMREKLEKLHKWLSSPEGIKTIRENREKSRAALEEIQKAMKVTPEKMQDRFTI